LTGTWFADSPTVLLTALQKSAKTNGEKLVFEAAMVTFLAPAGQVVNDPSPK
jgi:hypothetical protein